MLLGVLVVFAFFRQGYALYAMDQEIEKWTGSLDTAMTERETLNTQKELLYDADYIAILAREKLFFIYPEEKVWLFAKENENILSSVETKGIIAE
ncbi:MAG TPA: septum formation initiator family protein [Clostridiales bacterium]|nr:septum formation initiator family protein [Clostridiales bacterium]